VKLTRGKGFGSFFKTIASKISSVVAPVIKHGAVIGREVLKHGKNQILPALKEAALAAGREVLDSGKQQLLESGKKIGQHILENGVNIRSRDDLNRLIDSTKLAAKEELLHGIHKVKAKGTEQARLLVDKSKEHGKNLVVHAANEAQKAIEKGRADARKVLMEQNDVPIDYMYEEEEPEEGRGLGKKRGRPKKIRKGMGVHLP
jgi:hypothetical protein